MSRWDLLPGALEAHDDPMIDLSEWEDDLAKLQVTQAPHRLGGRVIWIATRTADGGDVKAPLTVAA
jgi:hypothetical protein